MESAPARVQSRIPPFRLSKTVQPAPHKGQRRWIPRFSGQISSADAKNGAKKRVFLKCLLSPRGTRAAGHSVSTHTMLRAALKRHHENQPLSIETSPNTHNAACGIETIFHIVTPPFLRVSTHTMLRAALKRMVHACVFPYRCCLDTHNAACGIDSKTALRVLSVTQSRFRMQKAHSNLDDAAHYRRTLIINTVNTMRNVKEALINSARPS